MSSENDNEIERAEITIQEIVDEVNRIGKVVYANLAQDDGKTLTIRMLAIQSLYMRFVESHELPAEIQQQYIEIVGNVLKNTRTALLH